MYYVQQAPIMGTDQILNDVQSRVTRSIIQHINDGVGILVENFFDKMMPAFVGRKKKYHLFENTILLSQQLLARGFSTNIWGTKKYWKRMGYQVPDYEKSCITTVLKLGKNTSSLISIKFLKIFNADQIIDLNLNNVFLGTTQKIEYIEDFVKATNANVQHGKFNPPNPQYCPYDDTIRLPFRESFRGTFTSTSTDYYYSSLLHELIHWTGAPSRCNREIGKPYGSIEYAFEELVAELGAAFLCSYLNLNFVPRREHAGYIVNWLDIIENKEEAFFSAFNHAKIATEYLSKITNMWTFCAPPPTTL